MVKKKEAPPPIKGQQSLFAAWKKEDPNPPKKAEGALQTRKKMRTIAPLCVVVPSTMVKFRLALNRLMNTYICLFRY